MTTGTIFGIAVLAFLGWAVPVLAMRMLPDTLRSVVIAALIALPVLTLAGAGVFAWLYAERVGSAALSAPGALAHYGWLGVRGGLVWGPVLALTALGLAHGVERRRGERMAARDRD